MGSRRIVLSRGVDCADIFTSSYTSSALMAPTMSDGDVEGWTWEGSFRVGFDRVEVVGIALDFEVKAPAADRRTGQQGISLVSHADCIKHHSGLTVGVIADLLQLFRRVAFLTLEEPPW
jgi:hypothetical protein